MLTSVQIIQRVTSNVGYIAMLPEQLKALVTKAYVRSLLSSDGESYCGRQVRDVNRADNVLALSMVFLTLAFASTVTMREKPL
jgi:hypothetical protein